MLCARNHLLADFEKCWHSKWRNAIQTPCHDSPLYALQHFGKAFDVQQSCSRVFVSRAQQNLFRLVRAQDVIDEVGRERTLPAGLLASRPPALDKTGDDRAITEG